MGVHEFVSEELLDYCETEGDTTIFAYTSTLGGMYKWNTIYDHNHPALSKRFFSEDNERRFSLVQAIAAEHGVSLFQLVFAWMLKHPAPIIPVLGVRTIDQLKDNLASLKLELSDQEYQSMNSASFNNKNYLDTQELSLI